MTHGRKPRRPRQIKANAMQCAILSATKLTATELASTMEPVRTCLKAVREGVATQLQFEVLKSSIGIAEAIEKTGIVRGLAGHIASALTACGSIEARALAKGTWAQTPLHFQQLDALTTAVDMHQYQLQQLSAGELQRIVSRLIARTTSGGGTVVRIPELTA